jgi:hypothetical protein
MHMPLMQGVLSTEPVDIVTWLELAAIALGLVMIMETDKYIRFRGEKRL